MSPKFSKVRLIRSWGMDVEGELGRPHEWAFKPFTEGRTNVSSSRVSNFGQLWWLKSSDCTIGCWRNLAKRCTKQSARVLFQLKMADHPTHSQINIERFSVCTQTVTWTSTFRIFFFFFETNDIPDWKPCSWSISHFLKSIHIDDETPEIRLTLYIEVGWSTDLQAFCCRWCTADIVLVQYCAYPS